ncbi:hypothetical protein GCM10009760_10330 [Kitasatospora kazusensis]|uniref:Uncharacterized protein n=1 Tax=Kitasatospora kazusensis TaxID=407974 RepID=A0ABN2YX81_9ACTN
MNRDDSEWTVGSDGSEEVRAGRILADLAAGVDLVPVPMERVVAGGRRLRRRRTALTGAAALVTAVVLGGGALAGAGHLPGSGPQTAVVAAAGGGSGTSLMSSVASSSAARNAFEPVRVVVAQGTSEGKEWKAWAALWPAAQKSQAVKQARMVWQEQHAAGSDLPEPTDAFVLQYWQEHSDVVDLYLTVDGKRLARDFVETPPTPSGPAVDPTGPDGLPAGALLGNKDAALGAVPVAMLMAGPDVAKVVVTWQDGSTSEPVLTTVGDSPVRWIAVAQKPHTKAEKFEVYNAQGKLLGTSTGWLT